MLIQQNNSRLIMEAILPFKIKNEQKFFDSALKVGYNEMEIVNKRY